MVNMPRRCATPLRRVPVILFGVVVGCATAPRVAAPPSAAADASGGFGVIVMAHGGSPEWNQQVISAAYPLTKQQEVEVAFGMADPASIQSAVKALAQRGVTRIGVVRLFVSGDSFYDRTEQILGLRPGAPPMAPPGTAHSGHADGATERSQGHGMELWRIESSASYALSRRGLSEAPAMGAVLAARARALSKNPGREDVLILAHGPGDDAENDRWIAQIGARAAAVRSALPFRRVQVMTLREDWPEQRAAAQRMIRAFVEESRRDGITTIVIPFRVQGFGPYAEVLAGLDYVSDGVGLLPHANVTQWMADEIDELKRGPFKRP